MARIYREEPAHVPKQEHSSGRIQCSGVSKPLLGRMPSLTENSSISSRPNQKAGIEDTISATTRNASSKNVFCLTASKIPSGMAIRYVRTSEPKARIHVAGRRTAIILVTDCLVV